MCVPSSALPVLDASVADFDAAFVDACRTIGFAVVTGHGIPSATFEAMRSLARDLFDLPDEVKTALSIERDNYRGFIPLGFFSPNRAEVNGSEPDRYEGFKLHWECPDDHPVTQECSLYGPNRWPVMRRADLVPHMQQVVLRYWEHCDRLTERLLTALAPALGVAPATLHAWHAAPLTNMTMLHYPASAASTDPAGIHSHKDTNVLTLLHPDPVGGLEIRSADGSWLAVDAPPDALIVNTGEMLELWSGGSLVATPHRVVNRSGNARYSFPYFVVPNHDVTIEPLQPVTRPLSNSSMPVGPLSAEVWRTNWPDEQPTSDFDLGSLDR